MRRGSVRQTFVFVFPRSPAGVKTGVEGFAGNQARAVRGWLFGESVLERGGEIDTAWRG